MGGITIPLIVVTLFWGIIGAGVPWIIPRGPNRGMLYSLDIWAWVWETHGV